jgi:hypothetical protein
MGGAVASLGSAGAADASGPYHVANTGGWSLNIRSAPSLSASVIGSLLAGATIEIACQTTGDDVNGVSNIWDELAAGEYVSDYYTDTPGVGVYSQGIPQCSAHAPSPPAPAPSPSSPLSQPQPPPSSSTPEPSAVGLEGVNWADARDNFQSGWVIPTGLSASDHYSEVYAKAWTILSELPAGANTVRLPINPPTVLGSNGWWWSQYQGAIDAATDLGMNVILSYWGDTSQPGTIEGRSAATYPNLLCSEPDSPYSDFDDMWHEVISRYGGQSNVYFEIMNEPHGYADPHDWDSMAEQWLACFPNVPKDRVIVSAAYDPSSPLAGCEGLQNDLADVASDPDLDGTLLSLHFYDTYCPGIDDEQEIGGLLSGVDPGRVVVDEFGTAVTDNGSSVRFGDLNSTDPNVRYLQQLSTFLQTSGMGAVYWPGLRGCDPGESRCDPFSVWSLDGYDNLQPRGDGSIVSWLQTAWGLQEIHNPLLRTKSRRPHRPRRAHPKVTGCRQLPTKRSRHMCEARSRAHRATTRVHRRHVKRPGRHHSRSKSSR